MRWLDRASSSVTLDLAWTWLGCVVGASLIIMHGVQICADPELVSSGRWRVNRDDGLLQIIEEGLSFVLDLDTMLRRL